MTRSPVTGRRRGPASGTRSPRGTCAASRRATGSSSITPGTKKAVVGICRAAGDAYADPADKTGKLFAVDVEPVKKLEAPVTLAAIKADRRFATFVLTRVPRLSVMPVSDEEWKRILEMSEGK